MKLKLSKINDEQKSLSSFIYNQKGVVIRQITTGVWIEPTDLY